MTMISEAAPSTAVLPPARSATLRLRLLGRSVIVALTSMTGLILFVLWVTFVAVSPISVVAPLVLPVTVLVRAYANGYRRRTARLIGAPIPSGYRTPSRPGLISRIWAVVRDPASWRDAAWLLSHAVVGFVTSILSVTLFLGAVFYLVYPFLFWVTPQRVFGTPFGGWHELHTVADATIMMPLALVCFGLWYLLQLPLTRLELALTRALLGPR
jgi:hypothetical protein